MFDTSVILQTMLSMIPLDLAPNMEAPNYNNVAQAVPVCYGAYGCFPVDGHWSGPERPVAVVPQPPYELELVICLHTQQQAYCHILDVEDFSSISKSTLNTSNHLFVVAHGFIESRNIAWMSDMVKAVLNSHYKPDVITVGWGKAAQPPYTQAVANTRIVGHIVGYLLHILVEYFDHKPSLMHLVGHSLGSHLMGYAGSYFQQIQGQQVSRITALDPAGPYYTNTAPEVSLDPSDAGFVQVIHTDETSLVIGLPISLGNPAAIGHVDYYPNGGLSQSGCEGSMASKVDTEGSFGEGIMSYVGCHHQRSVEYFIEAISRKCEYVGVACTSWEDYLNGRCWGCHVTNTCYTFTPSNSSQKEITQEKEVNSTSGQNYTHIISTQKPPVNVMVFFGTSSEPTFCAEQYLVTVISSSSTASMESGGAWARFEIMLMGTLNNVHINPPNEPVWLSAGGVARWVGFGRSLGKLRNARVTHLKDPGFIGLFIPRLNHNAFFLEKIFIEELSTGRRIDLFVCTEEIKTGELQVMYDSRRC